MYVDLWHRFGAVCVGVGLDGSFSNCGCCPLGGVVDYGWVG